MHGITWKGRHAYYHFDVFIISYPNMLDGPPVTRVVPHTVIHLSCMKSVLAPLDIAVSPRAAWRRRVNSSLLGLIGQHGKYLCCLILKVVVAQRIVGANNIDCGHPPPCNGGCKGK